MTPYTVTARLGWLMQQLASTLGWLLLAWLAWQLWRWGVQHAVWQPDADACRAAAHQAGARGACWGVVAEKALPMLLGHYPADAGWRPLAMLIASSVMLLIWAVAAPRHRLTLWGAAGLVWLPASVALLHGAPLGLPVVPSEDWGGLPLTLLLFLGSWWLSVPIGVGLALARRQAGTVGWLATVVIEAIRGVPLVTLLFAAVFVLPLVLPQDATPPVLARAGVALVLFASAYLAEIVRGGLQTIPTEQHEAGEVLGLSPWGIQRWIVLPQAIRVALPALTGHAIGLLKDTSLVVVVGLHELTGGLSLALAGDPLWRPFYFEAYLFVGLIYALMCLALSMGGRRLERRWLTKKSPP